MITKTGFGHRDVIVERDGITAEDEADIADELVAGLRCDLSQIDFKEGTAKEEEESRFDSMALLLLPPPNRLLIKCLLNLLASLFLLIDSNSPPFDEAKRTGNCFRLLTIGVEPISAGNRVFGIS